MSGTTSSLTQEDYLKESLQISLEFLSSIIHRIQSIGEFVPEQEFIWNSQISYLTASISQFVEVTTLMSKTLQVKRKVVIPQIKESHIHLLFIVKAMNQAHQNQDMIALEDLIKYELKDNLTQWKIDFIPQIKRILNS